MMHEVRRQRVGGVSARALAKELAAVEVGIVLRLRRVSRSSGSLCIVHVMSKTLHSPVCCRWLELLG